MLKLRHTGVYVQDLEKVKNFYLETFGMQVAVHAFEKSDYIDTVLGVENVELELYKLQFHDGSMLELIHRKGNADSRSQGNVYDAGCFHMAFTVDAIEPLAEKLTQSGIAFLSKPTLSADGGAKVCFCKDPEGNFIELVEEQDVR